MALPPDWNEFFRLFSSNRARFLVVGAPSQRASGRTKDLLDVALLEETELTAHGPKAANAKAKAPKPNVVRKRR